MWIDDHILEQSARPLTLACFVPEAPMVVLGCSNDAVTEVHEDLCSARNISVLHRYGGGGAVVLYDGCVVVSLGLWVKQQFNNKFYFHKINQAIIATLAAQFNACGGIAQDGISDMVYGVRKVAGSSMFRSRNYLLYQASLIIDLDVDLIGALLKHPSREPDYRKARSHADFLCGLSSLDGTITKSKVRSLLLEDLPRALALELGDELIDPKIEQIPHILARARRGH